MPMNPNFNPKTFRYTPQLVGRKDTHNTTRTVKLTYDNGTGRYVGTIEHKRGTIRVYGNTDSDAARNAIKEYNKRAHHTVTIN